MQWREYCDGQRGNPIDITHKDRWWVKGILLLFLMLCASQVLAFEGDYIWEERFTAVLSKVQSGQAKDQYALGEMYFRGRGTAKNSAKALHWFLLAAKQGHKKAAYKAGYLYLYGDGIAPPISPQKAFPWIKKAAIAGYVPAQYELGRLYASNKVIKRDKSLALKWLGRAKMSGYAPAQVAFDKAVKRLVKEQKAFSGRGRVAKVRPKTRSRSNLQTAGVLALPAP